MLIAQRPTSASVIRAFSARILVPKRYFGTSKEESGPLDDTNGTTKKEETKGNEQSERKKQMLALRPKLPRRVPTEAPYPENFQIQNPRFRNPYKSLGQMVYNEWRETVRNANLKYAREWKERSTLQKDFEKKEYINEKLTKRQKKITT